MATSTSSDRLTPASSSPRQSRRKAATRKRIVDAAEELFAIDPEAATVARIADAADVSVATVYQHFVGRDDVHLAVVERAVAAAKHHLLAAYDSDGPPMVRLAAAAAAYLQFNLESPHLFRVINLRQGRSTSDNPVALVLADQVDELTKKLADVIEQAVVDESLRPVDPLATARFLWGSMNGVFGLAVRPDRLRLTSAELLETVLQGTRILLEGLAGPAIRDEHGHIKAEFLDYAGSQLARLLDPRHDAAQ
ncbi:TetR/AcrR family transcriptional regulator [Streptomyces sp. NPDC051776]|uniref:TetR/AcrR family transcriptional regulator n=1 Tax=Streptomyces sp. NPDC051776 TaxID=3155414 RepID=UPI00344261E6